MSLSLAVAAKGPCRSGPFFDALTQGGALTDPRIDIHLAGDATTRLDSPAPGGVEQVTLPGEASVFALWGAAAAAGRGSHVAILDIHSPPEPAWFAAVLGRLETDPEAFYGPVEPAYPATDPRIVGYLVEYAQFHRPVAPGMAEAAGTNFVLRRALALGAATADGFVKTLALKALSQAPGRLDAALVRHAKPFALGPYIARRYRHGRSYAAQRMAAPGAPPRLLALAATPVLPLVRTWRIGRHAARIEALQKAFWRRLPAILAAETGWSAGEALGYLAGAGGVRPRLD